MLLAHGNESFRLLRRAALKGKTPAVASGNPALMNAENPWITHSTRTVYENPWIRVSESQVTNPSGGPGIYGVVHFRNRAIGVLPIDDEGHTWLVGQYRYTLGTYEWEIPEGGCPDGESALDAAKRELREETGLIASHYRVLLDDLALSNSVSDERATIFVATGLTQAEAEPEETEDLRLRRLPLGEAITMVRRGEITDSISVIALLAMAVEER
jgi:8-oxo-dGTP pyrophosphatase MutT (NUDIX family)